MPNMDPAQRQGEIGAQRQVYQPLSPRQTRVLRVHSSTDSNVEIECDLFTVDLKKKSGATVAGSSKKAGYDALSYTWGDPEPTKRILVNGLPFWISANLFAASRHLRLPGRPRVLWIDAICINQNDLIKKAGQVGMMFSIYLKAYRVVVWLGQATNDDEYLFSLLKTCGTEGMRGIRGEVEGPRARKAATELIEIKP
ncbi:heterokaryon incompatibility protein-domain-containing protein, partial [Dactylonectria macrodidyma]